MNNPAKELVKLATQTTIKIFFKEAFKPFLTKTNLLYTTKIKNSKMKTKGRKGKLKKVNGKATSSNIFLKFETKIKTLFKEKFIIR